MKNRKNKKILLTLLIIIVFIIGIFIGRIWMKNKDENLGEDTSKITTQIVEVQVGTQTIENTLSSSGEIATSDTEQISLSTSKYFKTMCVETGDIVLAGENILQYTNGTYLTAEYNCLISDYSVPETSKKCTSSNYVEVQNLEIMTMNLSIDESDINKVAKGQEVEIKVSALDNGTYTGTIKSVSGIGTYQTSGTTFSAVVEFENDGNAKPGMSATCLITLEKVEDCIAVPISAVQTNNNQKYVVIVDNSGNTQNVNIETGISNDSYVQVTSGLSGGETIQMVQIVTTNSNSSTAGKGNYKGDGSGFGAEMKMQGAHSNGGMQDRSQMKGAQ